MLRGEQAEPEKATAGGTLRLVWPQWQGAGSSSVSSLMPEFPFEFARRGYAIGSATLNALLPPADGPEESVTVPLDNRGVATENGIEAKQTVTEQLADALRKIDETDPDRILTLGGDCAVSVGPFSALGAKYPGDVAIIWVDSHPDTDTPKTSYTGYHAMAVSALLGHGDDAITSQLPYVFPAEHVALIGVHSGEKDALANVDKWGLTLFTPESLRSSSSPLLSWLRNTGCNRIAVHFDVDTVDSTEFIFGLGAEANGLKSNEVHRIIGDVSEETDVVGFTVAEFIPRQVMNLLRVLEGMPLIG